MSETMREISEEEAREMRADKQRILQGRRSESTDKVTDREASMPQAQCMRHSARSMLESEIMRLKQRTHKLQCLLKALPMELPPDADEALWEMICSMLRN